MKGLMLMFAVLALFAGFATPQPEPVWLCDIWQSNYRVSEPAAVEAFYAFDSIADFKVLGTSDRRMIVWSTGEFELHLIEDEDALHVWAQMPDDDVTRANETAALFFRAVGADASHMETRRLPEQVPTITERPDFKCPVPPYLER